MGGGIFGSGILDVAIGLVLLYLILSMMASALGEVINSALHFRTQGMEQFVRSLFMRPEVAERYTVGFFRWIGRLIGRYKIPQSPAERYVDHFYNNTLIAPTLEGKRRPAYIASHDFAMAIFDTIFRVPTDADMKAHLLTTDKTVSPYDPNVDTSAKLNWMTLDANAWRDAILKLPDNSPIKPVLLSLLNRADGDIDKLRAGLENWFDSSMERISGWYKRRTQFVLLSIGLIVAIVFNIDTVSITNKLLQNPALRAAVADAATIQLDSLRTMQQSTPVPGSNPTDTTKAALAQVQALEQVIVSLNLPIGWNQETLKDFTQADAPDQLKPPAALVGAILQKILGLAITGFAVSQGAPFWFDLLNKLTNVRSGGKPPAPADGNAGDETGGSSENDKKKTADAKG